MVNAVKASFTNYTSFFMDRGVVPVHTLCTQLSSATDFELIFQTSSVLATARALLMGFTVCLAKL